MSDPVTIINAAQTYAGTLVTSATEAMEDANDALSAIASVTLDYDPIADPEEFVPITMPAVPVAPSIDLTLPTPPAALGELPEVSTLDVDLGDIPNNEVVAPTLLTPTAPSAIDEFAIAVPTIDLSTLFPTVPSELSAEIDAPTFTEHAVPVAPTITLPVFSKDAPEDNVEDIGDLSAQMLASYRELNPEMVEQISDQVDAWITKMNPQFFTAQSQWETKVGQIVSGGTAVDAAVFDAVTEIEKEKANAEYRRTSYAARDQAGKQGFLLPQGFVVSAAQQARQAAADNNARAARDYAIKVFELEQEAVKFALSASQQYRTTILSTAMSFYQGLITINGQALDAAQRVMQAMVEVFNAQVKRYSIALEGYKAEATVYQIKMEGALARVKLYEAEIRALEALTNVDKAKVDIYRGQVDALRAYADVYKTQVDAVVSKAQLEKLKIDVFGAQVDAYKAKVSGKSLEHEAYKAALQANETSMRVYIAQLDAEKQKVEGFKTLIDTKTRIIESQTRQGELLIRRHQAELDAYRILVAAQGDVAKIELEISKLPYDSYRLELQKAIAEAQRQEAHVKAQNDVNMKNAEIRAQMQYKQADLWMDTGKSIASISTNQAQIATGAAQGALNGINSLVTLAG